MNVHVPGLVNAGFWTPSSSSSLREGHLYVACVSQKGSAAERHDVNTDNAWKSLYQLASRGLLRLILHIGGVVLPAQESKKVWDAAVLLPRAALQDYSRTESSWDNAFSRHTRSEAYNEIEEQICEIFRSVYRKSWTTPFVRHALANCSNIMILVRRSQQRQFF